LAGSDGRGGAVARPRRPAPRAAGAEHVLLAAAPISGCIDATEALARAGLAWWRAR
jgi:hypothetical protein